MESNKLKEVDIEYRRCYYFDDITKIEGFDFDNILIDEKSYENILIYDILKLCLVQNHWALEFILYYFVLKNMMLFMINLDI